MKTEFDFNFKIFQTDTSKNALTNTQLIIWLDKEINKS